MVKNLLELKNARRVTIDGNLFEYSWSSGQAGYAIVFTPRNQEGGKITKEAPIYASKVMPIVCASSGASSGRVTSWKTSSSGACERSSIHLPSDERPHRLSSIE